MTLYVNAEKIDEKHIQAEVEKLRPDYERVFADKPEPQRQKQLYEWSRENVIEAVLLRQVARKNQKDISPEAVNKAYEQLAKQTDGKSDDEEQVKKEIAERMRIERLISKITGNIKQPSDKDIRKYFQKNTDRFTIAEMARASHIVMHHKTDVEDKNIKEKMQQILKELRDGADFDEMARKHSNCPENAGDLGFFPRGSMVQGFEDVVFGMEVGQTSDVFKTEFGYHIAKVTDKRPATPCRLEDVREVIVRELTAQARQKALEKFVDAQKAKALIEEK